MTINGGIIAHEYFHAMFSALVESRLSHFSSQVGRKQRLQEDDGHKVFVLPSRECPESGRERKIETEEQQREIYHVRLVRAMNEGLADFWGWLYSGDPRFVGKSVPRAGAFRDLDRDTSPITSFEKFSGDSRLWGTCSRRSGQLFVYDLGSQYAHWLRAAFKDWSRDEIAKLMPRILLGIADHLEALKGESYARPALVLEVVARAVKQHHPEICRTLLGKVQPQDLSEANMSCEEGSGK